MKTYSVLNDVIFLDIETTHTDNKVIRICAVKIKNNEISRFSSLVNPDKLVELSDSQLLRGITQKELDSSCNLKEVLNKLQTFIEQIPLVCFDVTFKEKLFNIHNEFLDIIELLAILFPELRSFELQYLLKKFIPDYKKDNYTEFSYVEDIILMANYAISHFYYENGYSLPMSITELEKWNWYKHITKVNMEDVKCFIENKAVEFEEKANEPYPVFALKDYEKLFEHKEIWRRNGRSYTLRPQQRDASKFIREGLEKGKITIMEAPTGLGKSMAYLLPAAIYTHLKQQKVIISTNTKGLQNQLVDKDIPNLLEALNLKRDVSYTLIKGKSNYLCFDRFGDIEYPVDMKTLVGYVYLKRLMMEKGIGEIEEISPAIMEKFNLGFLINQCNCDSELCDVGACRYKDRCYYAAKVEALKEAQLIVVNHSLLLKWPYKSIVPLENIVVDEAHNLTQEAYDAFENALVSYEFEKYLKEIYNSPEKSGYLYYLSRRAKKDTLPLSEVESCIEQCIRQMANIKASFENYITQSGISKDYNIKDHLNINNAKMSFIIRYLEYLKEDLSSLNISLEKAVSVLKDISNLQKDKRLKILMEKVEGINSYSRLLEAVINQSEEGYCFYFEVDKFFKWWKISSIPLDVSGAFYEKVLSSVKSCLFISATLSTDSGYNSLRNTLGINIAKSQNKEIVEVPPIKPVFDYKGKSVIYAMENIDPNDIGAFSEEMKKFVIKLLHNVEGNIIILFTSRKRLDAFKEEATESLRTLGIKVVYGKKDIEKLKSRDERYILLGSKGYFEGIDIPGDAMTTVILDKVPNINSKEPFYKSLIENQVERGKNYWQAYAKVNFPIVSIDLKQIYGRIIRTEYDYGDLFIMSKFDSVNPTVKKLESQLHDVSIIRKNENEIFRDLNIRVARWKQINLYKIMKEVKPSLKKTILEKKMLKNSMSLKEIEEIINEFMSLEYRKRNLKYDVNIYLASGLNIYIDDKVLKLNTTNREKITQYFNDIIKV
ncbi:DNA polymerase III [Clostridium carboxidivorans P7]|uniref:DNA 5'-3' helicase n=1 Tax=Clostridium carboxidivorans P7 TaxID=536227 RepID=C6PPR9_9CLOT|nr:helicase C-terminal domain-containing protein [Clostridium carboxidivorans]AKN30327.1 DNA polymerase III [Clostridium carboxidivorans P7]EET88799.1 Exonuclease RNase T and DNA polymerase III [Clostridium carboxidivorans P7]